MKRFMGYRIFSMILLIVLTQGCTPPPPPPDPTPTPTHTPAPPTFTPTITPVPWTLIHGVAYSPYRDCQSPDTPNQPTEEDIRQDLQIIRGMANGIRTYSSTGINARIPALAVQMGLRVSAGAWLGRDKEANEREIQGLIEIAQTVELDSVIVGNEVMLRGELTEDELLGYISRVKNAVDVPVTYAEIGGILLAYPRVMAAVDFEMVHLYPFWEGAPIDGAASSVIRQVHDIESKSDGKRVVIGETGWPSAGPANGAAVPSPENNARFAREFLTLAIPENIDFYYFDAFDEMWKTEGGVGSYWGLLYADRTFKSDVQNLEMTYNVTPQAASGESQASTTPAATQTGDGNDEFYVYARFADARNHYAPGGWMGDIPAIGLDPCWMEGETWPDSVIQVSYTPTENDQNGWAGMYWLQPDGNWGTVPEAGYDLTNFKQLEFMAKADAAGTQVKFFVGGVSEVSMPYPSSITNPIYAQEADPMDGFVNLSDTWQVYHIDLTGVDLSYVIDGFGWAAERARTPNGMTFYLDDIRFVTTEPAQGVLPPLHIYSGALLRNGLDMGVDSSGHSTQWVENLTGQMKASYPARQSWGVIFITVGTPASRGVRESMDLSPYRTLSLEMRSDTNDQSVYIGIKDRYQPDNGEETTIKTTLSTEWKTYTFDLSRFYGADLTKIYIPIEFVFKGDVNGETIYFRNIQYLP